MRSRIEVPDATHPCVGASPRPKNKSEESDRTGCSVPAVVGWAAGDGGRVPILDGDLSFGPPKTRKSRGVVSFPPFIADELAAHVAAYPDPEARGLVFVSEDGTPLRRSNFRRRMWMPAAAEAGLPPRASFHSLRHACASWLIHAGANPLEVAEKLRHARVTTTLSTYRHLFPGTGDRLDGLLESTRVAAQANPAAASPRPGESETRSRGRRNAL